MNSKKIVVIIAVAVAIAVVAVAFWSISGGALTSTGSRQADISAASPSGISGPLGALLNRPLVPPVRPTTYNKSAFSMCYDGWVQGNDGPTYRCDVRSLPSCI
ncbi:MAG: hypothetical protein WBG50_00145 [Desulfomonilaceae bacterium]